MNEHDRVDWLSELKPGDQVATRHRYTGYRLHEITKRTPSGQIIMKDGDRYSKDGREIGGDRWDTRSLQPVTPAILADIKHRDLVNMVHAELSRLDNINRLNTLSEDRLEELLAVLKKGE